MASDHNLETLPANNTHINNLRVGGVGHKAFSSSHTSHLRQSLLLCPLVICLLITFGKAAQAQTRISQPTETEPTQPLSNKPKPYKAQKPELDKYLFPVFKPTLQDKSLDYIHTFYRRVWLQRLRGFWAYQLVAADWANQTAGIPRYGTIPAYKARKATFPLLLTTQIPFMQAIAASETGIGTQQDFKAFLQRYTGTTTTQTAFAIQQANKPNLPANMGQCANNKDYNNVQWPIAAAGLGLLSSGLPDASQAAALRMGLIMADDEALLSGAYLASLVSASFLESTISSSLIKAPKGLPSTSNLAQLLGAVDKAYSVNKDAVAVSKALENTAIWRTTTDASHLAAYVTLSLLGGQENPDSTLKIALAISPSDSTLRVGIAIICAQVAGATIAFDNLPAYATNTFDDKLTAPGTNITTERLMRMSDTIFYNQIMRHGEGLEMIGMGRKYKFRDIKPGALPLLVCSKDAANTSLDVFTDIDGYNATYSIKGVHWATKFNWFFGDLKFESGSTAKHFYLDTGTYQVMLIASDAKGRYAAKFFDTKIKSVNDKRRYLVSK